MTTHATHRPPAQRAGRALWRQARRTTTASIDYYDHATAAVADFEDRVAALLVEPLGSYGAACADLTREIAHAQVAATRVMLRL